MSSVASVPKASLFGHPAGLYTLFFAEMWERFSYYGMRALLIFYMIKGFLGYGDSDAYTVYGAYTALVYMMPFFGGWLADRLLGARRSVIFGAILMAAGEAMLMAPQLPAILPESFLPRGHLLALLQQAAFFMGLGLLIVGNGFFKPNISTMVGSLYPAYPGKRDAGFTIFYMGINLGARHVAAAVRLHRRDLRLVVGIRPGDGRHAHRPGGVRAAAGGDGRDHRLRGAGRRGGPRLLPSRRCPLEGGQCVRRHLGGGGSHRRRRGDFPRRPAR